MGGIVLVMMSEEGLPLSIEVVFVPEDLAVEIDRDVISTLFELRLNVQESFFFFFKEKKFELKINSRFQKKISRKKKPHRFFFYSLSDALNDIFDDGDMVTVGFIISKPHHSPSRQHRVPVNFNDAIINLFSRSLEPK